MNKWFQAFGLMLLAALVCDLSGCAQTSGWLAKKSSKKADNEKLADSDKKSRDKDKPVKKMTAKELAEARARKARDKAKGDTAIAKAKTDDGKTKSVDAEHEKYAAAERQKRKKPAAKPEDDSVEVAANTKADKPKKPAKPTVDSPKTDDELDQFLAKADAPSSKSKKKATSEDSFDDIIAAADDRVPTKKSVVQVKKEVAKTENDDDASDWADSDTKTEPKRTKSANAAASFEDELESPFDVKARVKERESKKTAAAETSSDSFDDDSNEFAAPAKKKPATSKEKESKGSDRQGYASLCPNASPELRDLLKQMDSADSESMRQCLYRIGQLGRDGEAAIPVLRKMLKHEDTFVRAHAALAMTRLNLSSSESDVVVIEAVKSRDASLRSFGVSILDEMGSQATGVLDSLGGSLNDRDGQIRLRVAEILIRHEKWEYPALQTLLACLKDKDENVRWLTAYSLAELAPEDSPETVQALMKAAHDRVPKVQVGAVYALGEIGPSAKRASEELRRLRSSSNDDELKSAIDYTLKQINP